MTAHLKQDKPDDRNVLDQMAQGIIGKPIDRPEGWLKVSGSATYAAEYLIDGCVEGVIVTSTCARGAVTRIDEASVLSMPGVIAVICEPRMIARPAQGTANEAPQHKVGTVHYWGQPVALSG